MRVCLNGVLLDEAEAHIAPSDRGYLLGDGVFETIAVRRGQIKRLNAHLMRLGQDLKVIGLRTPWADTAIKSWIEKLLAENNLADAVVRITITRGVGPRGLLPPPDAKPTLLITTAPMPEAPEPARLIVTTCTRRNEHSPTSRIKNLNYLDNILARQEAQSREADDAVLLNTQGRVCETTVANIFALIGGGILTPPISEGALPGVMRADVMALGRGEEAPMTVEMLMTASEVFLSNALGIRPVIAIEGQSVGDGEPGLITQLLAARL
jgi:branched-chain amino acid aminotransferase